MKELFLHNLIVLSDKTNEEATMKLLNAFEQTHKVNEVVYDHFVYDGKKLLYMDFISTKDLYQEICELSKNLPKQQIVVDIVSNDCENGGFQYVLLSSKIISDEYIDSDWCSEFWIDHTKKYEDSVGDKTKC